MKLSLLLGFVSLAVVSPLRAAPLVTGSLADYIALGMNGGTIGLTRFSEFTLLGGQTGATLYAPQSITINPINTGGMPGLQFVLNDSASRTDLFEVRFSYRVSDTPILGATLSIADSGATGNSNVTVVEDLTIFAQPSDSLIAFRTATDSDLADSALFGSITSLQVVTDITLDGGGSGAGLASLGSATSQFTIPEPGVLSLLAPAVGLLALRRRR